MNKRVVLSLLAALLVSLVQTPSASAAPIDSGTVWSYGGLYVDSYRESHLTYVIVSFKNSQGAAFTGWKDREGVHQCPNVAADQDRARYLRIHRDHPLASQIARTIFSAGLARKSVHVWFEATQGYCYIKGVEVGM